MRLRSLSLTLLSIAMAVSAPAATAGDSTLESDNVATTDGKIGVSLVSEAGYAGKEKPVAAMLVTPTGPKTRVVIPNVAAGRYAIQVMHDRNANGKLDTNIVGIPTEPYGFSNDAAANFGPPDFADAAFQVGVAATVVKVTLQ